MRALPFLNTSGRDLLLRSKLAGVLALWVFMLGKSLLSLSGRGCRHLFFFFFLSLTDPGRQRDIGARYLPKDEISDGGYWDSCEAYYGFLAK